MRQVCRTKMFNFFISVTYCLNDNFPYKVSIIYIYIFHPIWHYNDHANGCNKSQHCCVLLRVFGQQCCVCVRLEMQGPKSLTGFKLYATSANIVVVPCKRMQHVGPNNVACCWPTMSRPFPWAFTYQ